MPQWMSDHVDYVAGEFLCLLDCVLRGQETEDRWNEQLEFVDEAVEQFAAVSEYLDTFHA